MKHENCGSEFTQQKFLHKAMEQRLKYNTYFIYY